MTNQIEVKTMSGDLAISALAMRVRGEFTEMPGMRLTLHQAARLLSLPTMIARDVLDELCQASVLKYSNDGRYSLKRPGA